MTSGYHIAQHRYRTFPPSQKVLLDGIDLSISIYVDLTKIGQYQINFFGEYLCSLNILRRHFHTIRYSTALFYWRHSISCNRCPFGVCVVVHFSCSQSFTAVNTRTAEHFITTLLHHSLPEDKFIEVQLLGQRVSSLLRFFFFFLRKMSPELTSAANSPLFAEEHWPWAYIRAHASSTLYVGHLLQHGLPSSAMFAPGIRTPGRQSRTCALNRCATGPAPLRVF